MNIIIPTKPSRAVTFTDIPKVLWDSIKIKWAMLSPFPGKYPFAASISHCQIEPKDPLRFFVVDKEGNHIKLGKFFGWKLLSVRTIMNPEIIDTGKVTMYQREGCMSFPDDKTLKIKRFENLKVRYWTFFGPRETKLHLFRSALFQHELDHMDCITTENRYKHN